MNATRSHALELFVFLVVAGAHTAALAQGTVIFSGGDVSIVASDGTSRAARQGDTLRQGERIMTGPNAMAQVRFADGALAGVRPDSNVELRQYGATTGGDQGVTLVLATGGVRVVNVESADRPAPLPMQVQSPEGMSVTIRGGDLETGRARGLPPEASFVARVNAGSAVARTGTGDVALPPNVVNGIGRTGITPMPPNTLPPPSQMAAQDRAGSQGKPPAGGAGAPAQAGSPGAPPKPEGIVAPVQAGMPGQPLPPGGVGSSPPPGGTGFPTSAGGTGFRPGPGPQPGVPVGAPPPQIPVAPTAASSMIGTLSKPPTNPQPQVPGAPQQNPSQFVAPPPGGNTTVLGTGGPGGSPFKGTTIKPPPR